VHVHLGAALDPTSAAITGRGAAEGTGWPWALAAVDHGRALVAEPAQAPEVFQRALAHHTRGGRPYAQARTHLAYGKFLRRFQHRVAARTQLRQALEIFEDLHAEPLTTRAAAELRASGETARKRDPSTLTKLTSMEREVAQPVSQGMCDEEVAARCWSPHAPSSSISATSS
jgi:hypothetical protein